MIEIDGSKGEGGGQIVRSSLALAAVTGQPLRLFNIRSGRKTPGLLRQHLAGVRAMGKICGADVTGAQLGDNQLTFTPGRPQGGHYSFEVGSAGSAVLVAQTVLPALLHAENSSTVTIGGGTHAAWAPPFDFFQRCFLPALSKMGASVSAEIESYGFYPAGGGKLTLNVDPIRKWRGLSLNERRGRLEPSVLALVAQIPVSVAERECDVIRRKMEWPKSAFESRSVEQSGGPGNVVMIECGFEDTRELFIGFGKKGVKAERVARGVLKEAKQFLTSGVPVGMYLADQLLLPMGIAASHGFHSEILTSSLTLHSQTHIDVLKQFLKIGINVSVESDQRLRVTVF